MVESVKVRMGLETSNQSGLSLEELDVGQEES